MLEYHAAYYRFKEDDGWYVVSALDFPGVNTQGRTLREARFMVKDALQLMVEAILTKAGSRPGRTRKQRTQRPSGSREFGYKFASTSRCRHETQQTAQAW